MSFLFSITIFSIVLIVSNADYGAYQNQQRYQQYQPRSPLVPDPSMSLTIPFEKSIWKPFGSTIMTTDRILLTSDSGNIEGQQGAVWNQMPFTLKSKWEILFKMKGGRTNRDSLGMALWLTEEPNTLGPVYGGKDYFKGLGIVFDSYDNDGRRNNPSISAHYLDGSTPYNHSDDGLSTQIAGCVADYGDRVGPVATQVSYNGTHISVYCDLVGRGEFRKCLVEPLQMRLDRQVYLGVTSETKPGQLQETQELVSVNVKGLPEAIRPPPQQPAKPAWQTGVPPPPPQAQAQGQAPPQPPQGRAYQDPGQYWAPPTPPSQDQKIPQSQTFDSDSEADTLHDKIDQLLRASAHTSLESSQAGAALKEVQTNVMQKIQHATNHIMGNLRKSDQALTSQVHAISNQMESLTSLVDSSKGSVDAGRIESERRSNQLEAELNKLQASIKDASDAVEKLSRSFQLSLSREIGKGTAKMAAATKNSQPWGGWFYFVMFQGVFIIFVVYRQITNKKLDKLL